MLDEDSLTSPLLPNDHDCEFVRDTPSQVMRCSHLHNLNKLTLKLRCSSAITQMTGLRALHAACEKKSSFRRTNEFAFK